MRQNKVVSCSQILKNTSVPLLDRARRLQRLEQAVMNLLPCELAAHCRVANLKNEILVLSTPSSAWAARLRFAAPELIKQLQCQFTLKVHMVQVRVQPESTKIQSVNRHPPSLSLASGTLLAQTANSVKHPALREALYRLAAKARNF